MNTTHRTWHRIAAAVALVCASAASLAVTEEELAAAKREAEFAKAQAEEAKARLGELTVQGRSGGGEAKTLNVEAKILAYTAVDRMAAQIVREIQALPQAPKQVVIYGAKEMQAVMQVRALRRQAELLAQQVAQASGGSSQAPKLPALESRGAACAVPAPPPQPRSEEGGAGPLPPLTALDAGLQVLSLFKTDKKIEGIDVAADDQALATSVLGHLKRAGIAVGYPANVLPGLLGSNDAADPFAASTAVKDSNALIGQQSALDTLQGLIGPARDAARLKAQAGDTGATCKEALRRDVAALDRLEAHAKRLSDTIGQLVQSMAQVDPVTGATTLQRLAAAQAVADRFKGAHVLQLKAVALGGATMTRSNLFTTSFWFSGGAIVSYLLFDGASGEIVLAGTAPHYAGFIRARDLPSLNLGGGAQ